MDSSEESESESATISPYKYVENGKKDQRVVGINQEQDSRSEKSIEMEISSESVS